MRRLFSHILLILAVSLSFATAKENLNQEQLKGLYQSLDNYLENIKNLDGKKVADNMYEKAFKFISKDKLIEKLNKLKNSKAPKMQKFEYYKDIKIKNYSEGEYAIVKWKGHLVMDTNTKDPIKEEKILEYIKKKMPKAEITLDKNSHTIHFKTDNQYILAVREKGKDWKFIDIDLVKKFKFLPKEVLQDISNLK
jgi:hypothetical protein